LQKSELIQKAKHTKDAIIQFKTSDFDHYAAGAGRDYHLVFFLNAAYLAGNTQMNLPALRQNFALMAKVGTISWRRQGRWARLYHKAAADAVAADFAPDVGLCAEPPRPCIIGQTNTQPQLQAAACLPAL
jgi:hypothetical protein